MTVNKKGTLFLVATPIGNLEDITYRAVRVLKEVDIIAAEDTRETLKLLNHLGFKKTLISYYEHNKVRKGNYLIGLLLEGKDIALVSDAGTPAISDPGEDLVRLAIENDITITSIPGPVAAITGLIISGMKAGRFTFEGFLPMNKKTRKERLISLQNEIRTIIFYEAPHKFIYTLKDIYQYFGDRNIVIARELTKKFEEAIRCTLSEAIERYAENNPKGEIVLIIEGANEQDIKDESSQKWDDISIEEHVKGYIEKGMDKKEAISKAAIDRGISKRDVYNKVMKK